MAEVPPANFLKPGQVLYDQKNLKWMRLNNVNRCKLLPLKINIYLPSKLNTKTKALKDLKDLRFSGKEAPTATGAMQKLWSQD